MEEWHRESLGCYKHDIIGDYGESMEGRILIGLQTLKARFMTFQVDLKTRGHHVVYLQRSCAHSVCALRFHGGNVLSLKLHFN